MEELPKLPIKIDTGSDSERLRLSARELVRRIRPEWPITELNDQIFTDGITNRLVGVWRSRHKNDMILIRIYGDNTDLFIDRQMECRNMRIMYKHGMAAPIYCSFLNGICYGYTPGQVLNETMVREPRIAARIAETMAQMHTLKPLVHTDNVSSDSGGCDEIMNDDSPKASLFIGMRKFLDLIGGALAIATDDDVANLCDVEQLDSEVTFLEQTLPSLQSPIVFCHNDLLLKNIIYNDNDDRITFIDFEYSDYNYQAFDIANHFCEFCGVDSYDPDRYPDSEFQKQWLQIYLRKWFRLTGKHFDSINMKLETEKLYSIVERFALASHLFWGLWALVQASNSSIQFDYVGFACNRLGEYFRRKTQLFHQSRSNGLWHHH